MVGYLSGPIRTDGGGGNVFEHLCDQAFRSRAIEGGFRSQRDTVCEHGHCKVLDVIRHHVGTATAAAQIMGALGQRQ